jgi:DNA mismatch endonuclease (patch repair protein)
MAVRRSLHRLGLRFRLHDATLPGRPDVVLRGARVAVFVDGCFWHGCEEHGVLPTANAEFWREKITQNRVRDRRADQALEALGWTAVHIWEHDDPDIAARRVAALCGRPVAGEGPSQPDVSPPDTDA